MERLYLQKRMPTERLTYRREIRLTEENAEREIDLQKRMRTERLTYWDKDIKLIQKRMLIQD